MNPRYKRGRWFTLRIPHPDGGSVAKSARTRDVDVAKAMERMLGEMLDRPKYHPILRAMLPRKGLKLPKVYGAWIAGEMDALLASLSDVDLVPYIDEWEKHLESRFGKYEWEGNTRKGETTRQYVRQVRSLVDYAEASTARAAAHVKEGLNFPQRPVRARQKGSTLSTSVDHARAVRIGGTLLRSQFTAALVSPWLASLAVKTATRRRYFAAVNQFAAYLVTVGVLERNPLADLSAPPAGKARDRHITKAEWLKLIDWQLEPYRTAEVLAHLGIELGVIPTIRRSDIDFKSRTVHARGTKRRWRDRFCYIYEWALPYLTASCKMLTPETVLVPRSVDAIRIAHNDACKALRVRDYHLHDSRHSLAVWMISAGAPFEVVAAQLGHLGTQSVQTIYGRFKPNTADAARWADIAEARDREQSREAK